MPQQTRPIFTNHQLVTLLWPLVIEQALSVLVGMADTVMVSSAGEAAISGVSLVDMINQLIITVFAALATGGAVVTSQYLGAQKPKDAARSAGQLVTLSVLAGVGIAVLCLVFCRALLRLFFGTITADVMQAAVLYFTITALSFPFLALYNAGAAIFRSVGNSAVSMKVSVLINLINFCGNALCVYGLHMGVAGVAVPTLVSRAVGAVVILALAARPDFALRITWRSVAQLQRGTVRSILAIGLPSACENSLFQLGRVLVVSMISLFGTVHITANAVANNLDGVGCIIGNAMCLGMITVVGRCVGAQDFAQALSAQLVWIHAGFCILLWPLAFVLPNALRAANDVRFTMIVSVASMLVWRLGFSQILCVQLGWGALGVWWAMILDWVCRLLCFVIRFASGAWKKHAAKALT